jgi:hypothetical protein
MELKPGKFCPLIKKDCVQLQCNWFIQVRGKDMNTGKDVDEWGCSIAWLPHLLIENAGQTRQTAAATESFRNEMVKATENTVRAMIEIANSNKEEKKTMRLIDASDDN